MSRIWRGAWCGPVLAFLASLAPALIPISRGPAAPVRSSPGADAPTRVLSLTAPTTEILCALGLEDAIVAVSTGPCPPRLAGLPRIARSFGDVNLEAALALDPDFAFCWPGTAACLRRLGVPALAVRAESLEGVLRLVREIGRIMRRTARARRLVRELSRRIERVEARVAGCTHRPLVYFEGGSPGRSRGPGSLTHQLITAAGGRNLAADSGVPFPLLAGEVVIAADPDVIIVESYGAPLEEIRARPGWESIRAVRDGRVFRCEVRHTSYGPGCVEGLERFARWFHPERFGP